MDRLRRLDGRWLALARDGQVFGYISLRAVDYGRGLAWERTQGLRKAAPEVVLEETHWRIDDEGVLRLNADGWDSLTGEIDFSAEPILLSASDARLSTRWLTANEINE